MATLKKKAPSALLKLLFPVLNMVGLESPEKLLSPGIFGIIDLLKKDKDKK